MTRCCSLVAHQSPDCADPHHNLTFTAFRAHPYPILLYATSSSTSRLRYERASGRTIVGTQDHPRCLLRTTSVRGDTHARARRSARSRPPFLLSDSDPRVISPTLILPISEETRSGYPRWRSRIPPPCMESDEHYRDGSAHAVGVRGFDTPSVVRSIPQGDSTRAIRFDTESHFVPSDITLGMAGTTAVVRILHHRIRGFLRVIKMRGIYTWRRSRSAAGCPRGNTLMLRNRIRRKVRLSLSSKETRETHR